MKLRAHALLLCAALASLNIFASPGHSAPAIMSENISMEEVKAAQQGWCNALVSISSTYEKDGLKKAKSLAGDVIDAAYGYNLGPVAFKPTWATGEQTFRPTRRGALSYFVGGDSKYNDKGFAIGSPEATRSPWVDCTIENAVIQLRGNTASTMGWVHTTAKDGYESTVDKTWTFIKDENGDLRIILHHSSTPFAGS